MHASSQLVVILSTRYFYVSSCPATCSVDTHSILKEISRFNNNNNNNNNNNDDDDDDNNNNYYYLIIIVFTIGNRSTIEQKTLI
jgi:hypothetical protein